MAQWGWLDSNFYDEIFAWFFVNIDSNYIIGFMVYPTKQLIGTFLELEDDKKIHPNERMVGILFHIIGLSIHLLHLADSVLHLTYHNSLHDVLVPR